MKIRIIDGAPMGARFVPLLGLFLVLFGATPRLHADEPFARSKDYDLEHSRIALRFDLEQKKVIGDVTHTLTILRDTQRITFDSAGLQIQSVTLDKSAATFETSEDKLRITLPKPAKPGEKFTVEIKYEGKPSKGLYFILPDKDYPHRPKQVWTQGESEDTRYYLPTYDYPNDRLTTETILTVPADWLTVSNGKLISVTDAGGGLKTWTWRESQPSSTYLITVVAGEFAEVKDAWRNIPVDYYAPKDRGDRLTVNYGRTPAMIDLFSKKLGVDYPWEKYAQSMVDDFVAGGMENASATTNTSNSLRHPKLVPEFPDNEDPLISHELAHQWFGDLVTCKDWGNIWLNEGFATFMESVWTEAHFGKDAADYDRWETSRRWFSMHGLYAKPIVRHDFDDDSEFDGNAYAKGGWVLYMLRHQLGENAFYAGLKHYLEVNRGKNVVTADLTKAIEEATHTNVDQFFNQWIYGAGAPKLDVSYTYDEIKKQVVLTVKQIQKREGFVGLFRFPVDVEITNSSGPKLYNLVVSKESEGFPMPSDTAPRMVLFDKGTQILKFIEFKKDKKEWLFQLKNASELADRADAAVALGKIKNDDEVAAALGEALRRDKTDGVRITAAKALGKLGSPAASRQLLDSLSSVAQPWIRNHVVEALGDFKDDTGIETKLRAMAREDNSFRSRAAALQALGRMKAPNAYDALTAAVNSDSPDGFLRDAALRAFGPLGDDKAVPLLRDWASPGKNMESREAAISSLARLQKDNKEITNQIAGYLSEPHFTIRLTALFALGSRGDASAIPALEALLKSNDLSIEVAPMIRAQIERLKNPSAKVMAYGPMGEEEDGADGEETNAKPTEDQRLSHLEQLVQEMNERLKSIETRLPPPPAKE
ncbi:MAG TPA: M1 family aminopeptidase [Verrucomicrobiae bacterium]|nr:M1 family aminopeptidase [Verrucomicrobiae bacterium]